ncbi:dual specificity protein phosphatase, putative [Hepatocystis sp. ex Piliocolobus tephrosceles]|nr:dual specificity protein phosphatase, putative [Hepatocystis sp. ex Piliocolobus tephrosceles]
MIQQVFDNIYISNVYNANDIYTLINLNIGGVVTCFNCTNICWCDYNSSNKTKRVFYKNKFLCCKQEFEKKVKYNLSTKGNNENVLINKEKNTDNKTVIKSDEAEHNKNNTNGTNPGNKNEETEESSNLSLITQGMCYEICKNAQPHYDYIIYPQEIIKNKMDKNIIQHYINSMVDLVNDSSFEYDTFYNKENEGCTNADNNYNLYEEAINKTIIEPINVLRKTKSEEDQFLSCTNKPNISIVTSKSGNFNITTPGIVIKDLQSDDSKNVVDIKQLTETNVTTTLQTVCELNRTLQKKFKIHYNNIYVIKHIYLDILDTRDENIIHHFDTAHAFIDDVIRNNKNVLVHCMAGISRCSSIILSYISKKNKKGIKQNFTELKNKYPFANPNESFYQQLLYYEKMNYTINGCMTYEHYCEQIKHCWKNIEGLTFLDLDNNINPKYKYSCKTCRFLLFLDTDIVEHDIKKHKIKKKYGDSCTNIFISQQKWLVTENKMKGVLYCPNVKCKNKLGKWSWTGICCSCGYLQIPAFMINISNIDRMSIQPN